MDHPATENEKGQINWVLIVLGVIGVGLLIFYFIGRQATADKMAKVREAKAIKNLTKVENVSEN